MVQARYEPTDAEALAPLLRSIGREIQERELALARIEVEQDELRNSPFYEMRLRDLDAEAAAHRRALHACRAELERLGCSLVGTRPLTIKIATRLGTRRGSVMWQPGRARG